MTVNLILTTAAAAELRVDGHVCELQLMHAALLDPPQVGWEAGIERSSRRNQSTHAMMTTTIMMAIVCRDTHGISKGQLFTLLVMRADDEAESTSPMVN